MTAKIAKQDVKPIKEKKAAKQKSMEETLWDSANKLRNQRFGHWYRTDERPGSWNG